MLISRLASLVPSVIEALEHLRNMGIEPARLSLRCALSL
jgi:hypothetical protein